MRNSVEALISEGIYPPGDATTLALELWTVVHEIAALLISAEDPCLPPWGDPEAFANRVMRSIFYWVTSCRLDRARCVAAESRSGNCNPCLAGILRRGFTSETEFPPRQNCREWPRSPPSQLQQDAAAQATTGIARVPG